MKIVAYSQGTVLYRLACPLIERQQSDLYTREKGETDKRTECRVILLSSIEIVSPTVGCMEPVSSNVWIFAHADPARRASAPPAIQRLLIMLILDSISEGRITSKLLLEQRCSHFRRLSLSTTVLTPGSAAVSPACLTPV